MSLHLKMEKNWYIQKQKSVIFFVYDWKSSQKKMSTFFLLSSPSEVSFEYVMHEKALIRRSLTKKALTGTWKKFLLYFLLFQIFWYSLFGVSEYTFYLSLSRIYSLSLSITYTHFLSLSPSHTHSLSLLHTHTLAYVISLSKNYDVVTLPRQYT